MFSMENSIGINTEFLEKQRYLSKSVIKTID